MITKFETCAVCGADVLTLKDSHEIAMCSMHSNADKLAALDKLEERLLFRINLTREEIKRRQNG